MIHPVLNFWLEFLQSQMEMFTKNAQLKSRIWNFAWCKYDMERFAVTPCNDYLWYELGWFWKEPLVSTRRFDQYALIVFWRFSTMQSFKSYLTTCSSYRFEAMHGEVSMYILFAVTPCVGLHLWFNYGLLRTCLALYSTTDNVLYYQPLPITLLPSTVLCQ